MILYCNQTLNENLWVIVDGYLTNYNTCSLPVGGLIPTLKRKFKYILVHHFSNHILTNNLCSALSTLTLGPAVTPVVILYRDSVFSNGLLSFRNLMISRVFLRSRSFQLLPAYCLFWSLVVQKMGSNPGLVELAMLGTSVI